MHSERFAALDVIEENLNSNDGGDKGKTGTANLLKTEIKTPDKSIVFEAKKRIGREKRENVRI